MPTFFKVDYRIPGTFLYQSVRKEYSWIIDDNSSAQACLKSKSTEAVAPDALDTERDDQWLHAQCAADLFSLLYIFSEGSSGEYDGEEHSAAWEAMCWLMNQAVPGGLGHSETDGDKEAEQPRDDIPEKMTPEQIEKAQALAQECVRKEYKGC